MEDLVFTIPTADSAFALTLAERMGWTVRRRSASVERFNVSKAASTLKAYTAEELREMVAEGGRQIDAGRYYTTEELLQMVAESEGDYKAGRVYSHEEVMRESRQRFL